jgi:hypothetical protein
MNNEYLRLMRRETYMSARKRLPPETEYRPLARFISEEIAGAVCFG